mgnify:FL=1|tara:strand:- start:41 stop:1075 length:1035 start_codon:yes stop_codon:yes gene_type:complete
MKKMHGGPHMDKMMGGSKYKMGHGGMYGKKKMPHGGEHKMPHGGKHKMPHGGKHDMDMEMYGGGMMTDARNRGSNMQIGGMSLKEVDAMQNPGLAKLPEDVRNKMGYKQKGGNIQDEIMQYGDKIKMQRGQKVNVLDQIKQKARDMSLEEAGGKRLKPGDPGYKTAAQLNKQVRSLKKPVKSKTMLKSMKKKMQTLTSPMKAMPLKKKTSKPKLSKVKAKSTMKAIPKTSRLQKLKAKAKSVASKFKPISVADAKAKKKKDAFKKESKFTTDTYSPIVSRSKTTKTVNRKKKVVTTKSGDQFPVMKKKSQSAKSFREAFSSARKSGKKVFTWQGRKYNTKLKGE